MGHGGVDKLETQQYILQLDAFLLVTCLPFLFSTKRFQLKNMGSLDSPQLKKRRLSDGACDSFSPTSQLLVKRLSDKAKIPTRGSLLAAGYDLYR